MKVVGALGRSALVIALCVGASWAQAAGLRDASTLGDLYQLAVEFNPSLGLARARTDTQSAALDNAYLGLAPRASVVGVEEREHQRVLKTDNPVYQVGSGSFTNGRANIEVEQPLVDFRVFAKLQRAKAQSRKVEHDLDAAQQRMIYGLVEAYVLAVASEDARQLAGAEEQVMRRHLAVVRQRASSGLADQADVSHVQSVADQARADAITAASAVRQAFAAIERMTGKSVPAIRPMRRDFPMVKPIPASPKDWVEKAESNPELLSLGQQVEVANATYEQARALILPRLSLRGAWGYNDAGGSLYGGGARTTDATIGLRLTIPIFNADGEGYTMREESRRVTEARYALEETRQSLDQKVKGALSDVIANADRAKVLASAASATQQRVADLRTKFQGGSASINDVLDAEREYVRVRKQQLQARYNYVLSTLQLKQYAGVIGAIDVDYVDSLIDRKAKPISAY